MFCLQQPIVKRNWLIKYEGHTNLLRHSPEADWSSFSNWIDHVWDGGTPGSMVLCELTRDFYTTLSSSCEAEDPGSGVWFQACLDTRYLRLQLASSTLASRIRQYGQKDITNHLNIKSSRSLTLPAEPFMGEVRRYTSELESADVVHCQNSTFNMQFLTPHVLNPVNTAFVKGSQYAFVG